MNVLFTSEIISSAYFHISMPRNIYNHINVAKFNLWNRIQSSSNALYNACFDAVNMHSVIFPTPKRALYNLLTTTDLFYITLFYFVGSCKSLIIWSTCFSIAWATSNIFVE